jgi:hypothetical protein
MRKASFAQIILPQPSAPAWVTISLHSIIGVYAGLRELDCAARHKDASRKNQRNIFRHSHVSLVAVLYGK